MSLDIKWFDAGMEPRCDPDPAYPHGIDLDVSGDLKPTCSTALPYPARRIGHFMVTCDRCGLAITVTTAGRPDDPRTLRVACKKSRRPA